MGLAYLASGFSACCDSLFTLITPNSWPLELVPLTLMVVELDLGASHSITVPHHPTLHLAAACRNQATHVSPMRCEAWGRVG